MKGSYILLINNNREIEIKVGALGKLSFPKGLYVYFGSAKRGIESRVNRHQRLADTKKGKLHWHIDYLLKEESVSMVDIYKFPGKDECMLISEFRTKDAMFSLHKGFGASDCKNNCPSHLFKVISSSKLFDGVRG